MRVKSKRARVALKKKKKKYRVEATGKGSLLGLLFAHSGTEMGPGYISQQRKSELRREQGGRRGSRGHPVKKRDSLDPSTSNIIFSPVINSFTAQG